MERKIYRLVSVTKKAGRFAAAKIKNRDFKNFYGGKSIGHLAKKSIEYFIKEGPVGFARQTKRFLDYGGFNFDPSAAVKFPNGLKGYFDKKEIEAWFKERGKKALIIIPSYNDFDVLQPLIESLHAHTPKDVLEVVIVDDYCQPENLAKLKTLESKNVTVFPRKKNGGFAAAVNEGLRIALTRKLDAILVNSDIIAKAGWFEALQFGAYNYHKDVGIVGPKLLYPDGRIQSAGSFRNPHAPEWFDHYYRFKPEDFGPANIPQYCLGVTGAVQYIKHQVLVDVGIFDPYPFAFEDMDLALRAWEKGYRSLYFPDSTLYHMESVTRKKNPTISNREKASVVKFWERWGDWFDNRNVRNEKGEIRLIYVLQTSGLSGGIKIVLEHANHLKKLGFAPEVWSLDGKTDWDLHVPHKTFANYDLMTKALAEEEAIKIATWWETAQPVWLGSITKGIPAYFIQEFETWFYPNDPKAQHAVMACYRFEFNNLTTSGFNAQELQSLHLLATRIPCGIDLETYKPLKGVKREGNTILALGRSFFQKNFKFTLKAWKALGEKRPDMWLYGQEKDMEKLDKKITYHLKPSNKEVNELFNKATIFVQTSYHEGFSLPPLEAMAAGCPAILTDSHGNRDYVEDGKNCVMVEQDNIPALKAAIKKLLHDEALRAKLAKNGTKTAQEYGWPKVIKKIATYYQGLADQPNREYISKILKKYK
ncbi:MAG TPA: glycosyltransferase [Candidatus Saccharimonadales bacterium]|nr:glycosyltransferase [Candidatus Saccharimonadales bacterium]